MRIALATLALASALAAPAAHAADQTILGSSISVKNPGAPEERTVSIKAKEKASSNTLVGDPTISGATLTIRMDGTGGPTGQVYSLPQGTNADGKHFWTGDASKGYRYKDPNGEQGPVADLQVKLSGSGQFSVSAKLNGENSPLAIVPLTPSSGACMFVEIGGGDSYSTLFSGGEIKITDTSFSQKKVTTEGTCVPTCGDGIANQDETDVDCGGGCSTCGIGDSCVDGSDCTSGVCFGDVCISQVCGNGVLEGSETCDDGNTNPCDGCSPTCRLESTMTGTAGPGLGASIPDGTYNGTQATMTCTDVTVPAAGDSQVDYVCVRAGLSHTWIGDLVLKLVSPSATVVTLMSRPGYLELADDGTNVTAGDSSNLSAAFPVLWRTGAADNAESMGNTIDTITNVCQGDGICEYAPNPGAATPGDLDTFIGETGPGTWKFCAGDVEPMDTGMVDMIEVIVGQ